MFFVSSTTDSGVAVKLGGAWGGFRKAMAEVLTGLKGLVEEVTGLNGRTWFTIEPSRDEARKGARMTRAVMMKRIAVEERMRTCFSRARMTSDLWDLQHIDGRGKAMKVQIAEQRTDADGVSTVSEYEE